MKKMKVIWKIARIILFFFAALFVISLIWYGIGRFIPSAAEKSIPFIDYVLYLLGFGDIDIKDHYIQTGFSTLGLFAVTLLSSVFTVNLFDLRRKLQIDQKITVTSSHSAKIRIAAKKKDAYDLTAVLIAKCGNEISSEEKDFPFVSKGSAQDICFKLEPGSVLYKYLRAVYLKSSIDPQLILTVQYTDIESGQEYKIAQKYQYGTSPKNSQFVFCSDESETQNADLEKQIREAIKSNVFPINLASINPCNAEDIDISYGLHDEQANYSEKEAFRASVHMNGRSNYDPGDFTMAVTQDLFDHDWTKFYDLNCALKFDYKITGNMAVTLEFKCGNDNGIKKTCKLLSSDEFEAYSFSLKDLNRDDLALVREICFTVFYRDVDAKNPIGSFVIKNCVLEVE